MTFIEDSNIEEALRRGQEIADAVVPDRVAPVRQHAVTATPAPVDTAASKYGQDLLESCKLDEPIVDEGYESYSDWRSRTFTEHGQVQGAGKLAKLWRATRKVLSH